ncbi:hypothetical protein BCV69DRAFT_142071 [Microstroma glucosiphilum]|uniref:Uncharacterized protein n=1 Tax=Pseudomicrostroma glucosiphilum TaxID=1684307 RepID=A0A316UBX3_9BASI|nr:hypothetical protein BCV69DRAFT_142071 [Pseudomicrostroma glucosiphilum]PWN22368.1 hypothetical protein BCV69DRAFT_142071 [Pseudomicrostroma glucosiphilum]
MKVSIAFSLLPLVLAIGTTSVQSLPVGSTLSRVSGSGEGYSGDGTGLWDSQSLKRATGNEKSSIKSVLDSELNPLASHAPTKERRSDIPENLHGDGTHPLPRSAVSASNAKRFSFWEHALNVAKWDEAHRGPSEPISSPAERSVEHPAESAIANLLKRFSFSEHAKNVRIWNAAHHILDHPIDQRDTTVGTPRKRFDFWLHQANVQKWNDAHADDSNGGDRGHFNHGHGFIPIRQREEDAKVKARSS